MDAGEFTKSMQSLGTRYVEEYTRGMQRYADLLNSIAQPANNASERGVVGSVEQQNRHTEFMLAETPKVLGRLAEAGIDYYSAITDLGVQTLNRYVDQVLQAQSCPSGNPEVPKSRALIFHGMRNQAATNAFLVSNCRNVEIDVALDVAEVVNQDGSSRFKPKAEFTPAQCQLAPNDEKIVQCSILLSDKFKAGEVYQGSIAVVGYPEMTMPFSVEVEEVEKVEEVAKPKKRRPARKKSPTRKVAKKPVGKK